MKKQKYSIREIAKYNTISVLGGLQMVSGIYNSPDKIFEWYGAVLKDLQTGAMERSCIEFDRIITSYIRGDIKEI